MNDPASQRARALWLSAPVVVAIGRLIDWWRLGRADEWAYYLGEPIPIFWALVLALCGLAATVPVRRGWLRAGVFLWLAVCYGVLPTQAGSMTAHPDYFLQDAVDQINDTIHRARSQNSLPSHAVELRRLLTLDQRIHYRRGQEHHVSLEVEVHPKAIGPVLKPANRPGVIHVARNPADGRIWVTATGLNFARFGAPVLLRDDAAGTALVLEHGALERRPNTPPQEAP